MNPNKTKILFGTEMMDKVIRGVDVLYEAVGGSLGPRARAVGVDLGFMYKINKDGVSIARSIHLEDPFENFGVNVVRESAQKVVDICGDGTSLCIVLAWSIIHECLKAISNGTNPMALREPLETGVADIIKQLDAMAIPINSYDQKLNIATISASGDKELGKLIADTLEEIGDDGIITIEESKDLETKVERQEGMQLENGYSHPLFINNPERRTAVYENVPILVSSKNILGVAEIAPFFDKISKLTKTLVIIAPDVSMDVMEVLLQNKLAGNFHSLVVKAPGVGENQRDILRDICALTGAKYVSAEAGDKFNELTMEDLGNADRIVSSKVSTIITGNNSNKAAVEQRVATIKTQMTEPDLTDFDREQLKGRLGKLTNGIAVLKIGGATEVEMKERKERAEDAVGATRAAIREGIVPGGEVALLKCMGNSPLFVSVLQAPFNKLMENAGLSGDVERFRVVEKGGNFGIDVTDGVLKDMVDVGIIDPKLCVVSALTNACSVAIQIISLGAVIVPAPEEKK